MRAVSTLLHVLVEAAPLVLQVLQVVLDKIQVRYSSATSFMGSLAAST